MGFGPVFPCFFRPYRFRGAVWYLFPSWDTRFWFHGRVRGREWHGSQILMTSAVGSRLCIDGELAWFFGLHSSVGACEVWCPTFQDENPKPRLNCLCLTMILLKALFWERCFFSGWKLKMYDRAMMTLVHYFLLKGDDFGEIGLQVLPCRCLCYCCKDWNTIKELFLFLALVLFFRLCASALRFEYCVVVEARYNWYLRDINIFPLLRKHANMQAASK
jgi:hypothetical protein